MNVGGIEAIHRVAQNLPQHMLHSLSQVATHTPGYPHTPGAAAAAAGGGFGGFGAFANTVRQQCIVFRFFYFENCCYLSKFLSY